MSMKKEINEINDIIELLDIQLQLEHDLEMQIIEIRTLGYNRNKTPHLEKQHKKLVIGLRKIKHDLKYCRIKVHKIKLETSVIKYKMQKNIIRKLKKFYPEIYEKLSQSNN